LGSLLLGIFAAVVVMVKVVGLPHLLLEKPTLVYAVFFGLVFASVFILGRKISWGILESLSLILGTAAGFLVVNLVPMDMPGSPLHMFAYGFVAISAMLLPGISGSFILLILGQYERIIFSIEALLHRDFSALLVLVPFGLGCVVGILAFSRVVAWLLRLYEYPVIAGLCGLLLGSLWRIWPYQHTVTAEVHGKTKVVEATPFLPQTLEFSVVSLLMAGFVAVFAVEALAKWRHGKR
jgi:putative membrane protein